jgi:mannitol/fructose-specific phosphotransferase system IIA component (Ntr-type)
MGAFGKNIPESVIRVFPGGLSKKAALETMMEAIAATGVVKDRAAFLRALFEREAIRSTGFKGIAIPHVRIDEISEPTVGVGISRTGIEFDALDGAPVNIIVLFAMPSGSDKEYLGYLAQVMLSLRTAGFTQKLLACDTPEEVARVIEQGP